MVNGDLAHYQDNKTGDHFFPVKTGNRRQIRDLLVESDGSVWGTTLDEVARWKDGVRKNLTTRNGLPCDGIFALVQDDRSTLWLYSQCGLIAVDKAQLDSWWEHPDSTVKFKLLDAFDGVQPGLTSLKPQATRSPDGRLWFVNGQILQEVDPDHLQEKENTIPPPVQVEEVFADRKNYPPGNGLHLPPRPRDLEIAYTGLTLRGSTEGAFPLQTRRQGYDLAGARNTASSLLQ